MSYICLDCSYRSNGKFPDGKCPACHSGNIKSAQQQKPPISSKEKRTLVEYFMLAVFWGFLLWGIWDRYLK